MQHRLQEVLNIQAQKWQLKASSRPTIEAIHSVNTQIPLIREIPVKLDVNRTPISYVSAIALLLENPWQKPASEIAQNLTEELIQTAKTNSLEAQITSLQSVWESVLFEVNSSGWITLKITDQGLSNWIEFLIYFFQNLRKSSNWVNDPLQKPQTYLRDLTDSPYSIRNSTHTGYPDRNSTDIFLAQHSHARCCSLLRLAAEAKLIQLTTSSRSADSRGSGILLPLPREKPALQFRHSSEHQLILQICECLDEMAQGFFSEPEKTLRRIGGLSQAFCRFYADCLILDKVMASSRTNGRLVLVDLVRSLLQILLQNGLGITAPHEL